MKLVMLVATHKKCQLPIGKYYMPVQAGREGKVDLGYQGDNTGENISLKNSYYSELTVMYWAWKNLETDFIGLVHYRRYFTQRPLLLRTSKDKFRYVLSDNELEKLIGENNIIVPRKRKYYIETLYSHYKNTHYVEPLNLAGEIIKNDFPAYFDSYNKVMKQTSGFMFNMFIMKKKYFDEYCNWLFLILEKLEKQVDMSQYDDFHARFLGRISELLFNVWLDANKLTYKEVGMISTGKTAWGRKIYSFIRSKFTNNKYEKSF